jgi:glutamate dehydrogenase
VRVVSPIHTQCHAIWSRADCGGDHRIDDLYLNASTPASAYRLETFRSTGSISATASQQLRCYFVNKCHFPSTEAKTADGKTDIRSVSDASFLEKASENTLDIYQRVMWSAQERYGPVIEVFEVEGSRERYADYDLVDSES